MSYPDEDSIVDYLKSNGIPSDMASRIDARKCPWRWTSAKWHSECEGFEPNQVYKDQWEFEQKE